MIKTPLKLFRALIDFKSVLKVIIKFIILFTKAQPKSTIGDFNKLNFVKLGLLWFGFRLYPIFTTASKISFALKGGKLPLP